MKKQTEWTDSKVMATAILFVAASTANADVQVQDYAKDLNLATEVIAFLRTLNNSESELESSTDAIESEKTIIREGAPATLTVVRPKGVKGMLPVFVFIHGARRITSGYPVHKRMVRNLVAGSGCVGVFVNYTPSNETNYSQAIHEIYATTNWVAEHGAEIGVDGQRLAIIGNSVGGNMTAVTTLMSNVKQGPKIRMQIMMWPVADAAFDTGSYPQFGDQRFLTTALINWIFEKHSPYPTQLEDVYMPSGI